MWYPLSWGRSKEAPKSDPINSSSVNNELNDWHVLSDNDSFVYEHKEKEINKVSTNILMPSAVQNPELSVPSFNQNYDMYRLLNISSCKLNLPFSTDPITMPELTFHSNMTFSYDTSFELEAIEQYNVERREDEKRIEEFKRLEFRWEEERKRLQDEAFKEWTEQQVSKLNQEKSKAMELDTDHKKRSLDELQNSNPDKTEDLVKLDFPDLTPRMPISQSLHQTSTSPNGVNIPQPTMLNNPTGRNAFPFLAVSPPNGMSTLPNVPGMMMSGSRPVMMYPVPPNGMGLAINGKPPPMFSSPTKQKLFKQFFDMHFKPEVIGMALEIYPEDQHDKMMNFIVIYHRIFEMGLYTPDKIKKAVLLFDDDIDGKKAELYLKTYDSLLKQKFKESEILDAFALFSNDVSKSAAFLNSYEVLSQLGFDKVSIKEALLLHDNNREKAAQYLFIK